MSETDPSQEAVMLEGLLPKVTLALFGSIDDPLEGLPMSQLKTLRQLVDGPKTPTQLAEALTLTPSAVSQLLSKLYAASLVCQEIDSSDRRVRHVSLSQQGRRIMGDRALARARSAQSILSTLSADVRDDLIRCLEALVASSRAIPEKTL